jgi:HD-like signal output (HDOD) protein
MVKGVEPSDAFLAGLMHDIGIIVEMQACREAFGFTIAALVADPSVSFRAAEADIIGANHEAFGEALCVAWRFPEALQQVTGFHHRPLEVSGAHAKLVAVVHVADHLAARAGVGYARTIEGATIDPAVLGALGVTAAETDVIAAGLSALVADVLPLLTGE